MESELNEQLKLLIELQELDSSILSIAEKIESLPARLDKSRANLKETTSSLQNIRTRYEGLIKKKKDKEFELDEIQERIKRLKDKSSEIKTNKEYEAHLKEIENYNKKKTQVEDELLQYMEEMEGMTDFLKTGERKVKETEDEFKKQERILDEEKNALYKEMEFYKTRRKDFVSRIDEELYGHYMNLLKKFEGLAVVPVENEVCLGCNTNIPPQLYNDIKEDKDIYTCYYCKRFLYYQPNRVHHGR